jgi:hypothetical protein
MHEFEELIDWLDNETAKVSVQKRIVVKQKVSVN